MVSSIVGFCIQAYYSINRLSFLLESIYYNWIVFPDIHCIALFMTISNMLKYKYRFKLQDTTKGQRGISLKIPFNF